MTPRAGTIAVKSSGENTIALPAQLMAELNLREGDVVKAVVDGQTLLIAPLARFLSLRGALADDDAFDRAMEFIDQAWQSWMTPTSV